MRRWRLIAAGGGVRGVGWGLVGLLIVAGGAFADTPLPEFPPSRPLDGTESYEQLVDESRLLLIARVLSVDSLVTSAPGAALAPPDSFIAQRFEGRKQRRALLEPVEWLHGGLDGDEVEVYVTDTNSQASMSLAWISQTDSLAGLIQLHRRGSDWFVGDYLRVLAQNQFRAVRDSIVKARDRISVDSLVARADLVIVAADSLDIRNGPGVDQGKVRVTRVLKGADSASAIKIQPHLRFESPARSVLFLRRIAGGLYEPLPFHSSTSTEFNDWDSEWERQPFATETAVRRALERLGWKKAGEREQR